VRGQRGPHESAKVWNRDRTVTRHCESGVVRNLPDVTIWISEIAGIPAVAGVRGLLSNGPARRPSARNYCIDFGSGSYVLRRRQVSFYFFSKINEPVLEVSLLNRDPYLSIGFAGITVAHRSLASERIV
jgi:hypothetical protein